MASEKPSVEAQLLDFTHAFRKVRRYNPRRVHITRDEWIALVMTQRGVTISGEASFDGARLIKFFHDDVITAIRAWDLMPYGRDP